MKIFIEGIQWTNKPGMFNHLPKNITLEVEDNLYSLAKENNNVEEFIKYQIGEENCFSPFSYRQATIK